MYFLQIRYINWKRDRHSKITEYCFPTGPFTILEPENQEITKLYLVQKCRSTKFETPNF